MTESPLLRAYALFKKHPFKWLFFGLIYFLPMALDVFGRLALPADLPDWLFGAIGQAILALLTFVAAVMIRVALLDLREGPSKLASAIAGMPWVNVAIVAIAGRLANFGLAQFLALTIGAVGSRLAMPLLSLPLAIPFLFVLPAVVDRNFSFFDATRFSVNATIPRYLRIFWEFAKLYAIIFGSFCCIGIAVSPRPRGPWDAYFHPQTAPQWPVIGLVGLGLVLLIPLYYILSAVLYEDPATTRMGE